MKLTCYLQILTLLFFLKAEAQQVSGWKYIGPKETREQVKGFIRSVWVDEQNPDFILAGSCSGGLFLTTNGLDKKPLWKNISDSYKGMVMGVSDIVVKPNTENKTIYISTIHNSGLSKGYGHGILKTTDGGISWEQTRPKGEGNLFALYGLVANKQNPAEMIAYSEKEIYITRDEWNSFEKIELPVDKNKDEAICDVEFAPFETGKFYVATKTINYYEPKLFVCGQYGKEVENIAPNDVKAERIEIAVIENERFKGKFYIALGTTNVYVKYYNGKIFTATNASPINHTFSSAKMLLELSVNSVDTSVIYLCMTETSRSTNGGKSFEKIAYYNGPNTHADNRAIQLVKSSVKGKQDFFIVGNDGGISLADKFDPLEWKNLNGIGLDVNQFWGIDVAQSDSLFVAGGTQDNGGFLLSENFYVNTMQGCGDAYNSLVVDAHSAIIQCNPPSMFYHNIKTNQNSYISINDPNCEGKRPILQKDSFIYVGYHNIWRINKKKLQSGNFQFEKFTDIPYVKDENGGVKNNAIRSISLGNLNSGVICYSNPNWGAKENNGKLFFCSDLNSPATKWIDITAYLNSPIEIYRWSEVNAVEMSLDDPNRFFISARDVFNQTSAILLEVNYLPDSNKVLSRKLNWNLPAIGINKIKTDKFSGITYLACDDGIYYCNLNQDSIVWKKLNGTELPAFAVMDLAFNYYNNTLVAGSYGRGVWQGPLVKNFAFEKIIKKSTTENDVVKIDGKLIVNAKKIYTINSKFIFTKGSLIELKRGSKLVINNKELIRDENNIFIDLSPFIKRKKTAKVVYR